MMRLVGCWAVLGVVATCAATGPQIPDDVKKNIKNRVDNRYTPGIVIGVIDSTGTNFFSYGTRSDDGDPVDADTVFEIGSITKVFTGTLLAELLEKGKVALDDPIEKFLPKNVTVPSRGGKKITLHHLATHMSGLPRVPDNIEVSDLKNPYAKYTKDKLYDFLSHYELDRDIGATYEYSNLGVGLLGHILGVITGQSYEQMVRKVVTKPLHMKSTGIKLRGRAKKHLATGHANGKAVGPWSFDCLAGCGALRSTATDMAKFVSANMGLTKSPATKALQRATGERIDTGIPNLKIGLGWHVSNLNDTTIVWHNGGTHGFHAFCGFVPATNKGVVVLTNSDLNIDDIGMHVLDTSNSLVASRKVAEVSAEQLASYDGFYEIQHGVVFTIRHDGSDLFATISGQREFAMNAESPTKFFYKTIDAQIEFFKGTDGKIEKLVLYQNGREIPAKKLGPDYSPPPERVAITIDPKILDAYVGRYELTPAVNFDVRATNGRLMVKITGQPRVEIYPESETEFFYKVVDAQITFVKGDDGKVSALVLHQFGKDQTAPKTK